MRETLPARFGEYILLQRLGKGGMGDVTLARPVSDRQGLPIPLVIKRIHGNLGAREDFVRRFRHEAAVAVAIDSPHIAKVYDIGAVGPSLYIVMQYIPGWSLKEVLLRLHSARRIASLASIVDVMDGVLRGLEILHASVDPTNGEHIEFIHRDVAPKNVMVGADGITRLIDLGIGKSTLQDWKTKTGMVVGTLGYMPPEQVRAQPIDHRVDIYATGVVLFEFLTGRRFIRPGPTPAMMSMSAKPKLVRPSSLRDDIPPELDDVVMTALAPDPNKRFESARAFREALHAAVPEWAPNGDLSTLVADIAGEDDGARDTMVRRLLEMPPPMQFTPTGHEETVVFGRAPGVIPLSQLGLSEFELATRRVSSEALSAMPMSPMSSSMPQQAQRSNPLIILVGLLVILVSVGVITERVVRRGHNAPLSPIAPIAPVEPMSASKAAEPLAAPAARGVEASPEPAARPAPVAAAPTEAPKDTATKVAGELPIADADPPPRVRSRPRRVRKPKRAPKRRPEAPAKAAPQSLTQQVAALTRRAEAAAKKLPPNSQEAKRINAIRAELVLVLGNDDSAKVQSRIKSLGTELDRLAP